MPSPFDTEGAWLRCALHAHTTKSDGELPPDELVHHYAQAGYDVLAITDHWVRTQPSATDGLVLVPGVELDASVGAPGRDAHVLALGVGEAPARPETAFAPLDETVDWVRANGGVPFLAHPYWSGLRSDELERCGGLAGLEVYNTGCDLETGRGVSTVHWYDALEVGRRWIGIAVDGSHRTGLDSGRAWTFVRAQDRSPAAVLSALDEGTFYSSTGPVIESVAVDGKTVEVRCSRAGRVTLVTGRERGAAVGVGRFGYCARGRVLATDDGLVTAAELIAPHTAPYGRVEVRDADGGIAWTNPLWT